MISGMIVALIEGLRLPVRGQGVWNLKGGDLVYIELEITELEYG